MRCGVVDWVLIVDFAEMNILMNIHMYLGHETMDRVSLVVNVSADYCRRRISRQLRLLSACSACNTNGDLIADVAQRLLHKFLTTPLGV